MSDLKIMVTTVLGCVVVLGLLMVGIVSGLNYVASRECSATAEQMAVEQQYGLWKGCLFKVNGRWYPSDSVRVTEDGRAEVRR